MILFPFISIIIPVKNEAAILGTCLESLMKLDYPKERLEVIIADGLSSDNTKGIALNYGVKVAINDKQLVVSGRNQGFKEAAGDIIAFTDADCIFDRCWLKNSIKYFSDEKVGGVGGATYIPQHSSNFEKAIDLLFSIAEVFQATSHRRDSSIAREVKDIPGCNAIYRKEALNKVMPVDENLLTAEDVWMNFCIRNYGYKLILAPDVIVWHYRRNSPKRFLRQVYRFAIGRMQVGKRNLGLLSIFHILVGLSLPLIALSGMFFYLFGSVDLYIEIILSSSLIVILTTLIKTHSLSIAINMLLVIFIFMVSWSTGFLRELFFPLNDVEGR